VIVAMAFSGIFAFAVENLGGRAGLPGWAWIFLIEGLMTVAMALASYWYMCDVCNCEILHITRSLWSV